MSRLVMTWTGDAVSAVDAADVGARDLDPFQRSAGAGPVCATAGCPALNKTPPQATISPVQSFVFLNMNFPR